MSKKTSRLKVDVANVCQQHQNKECQLSLEKTQGNSL